ncbi:hypothetical protein [Spirillospora sp. CA-294931]|uniref:hypothetical protein n=1 Tax=Spirillospora sp. CA-294931 TaxID=3240042 RepID=UPI003D8F9E3F
MSGDLGTEGSGPDPRAVPAGLRPAFLPPDELPGERNGDAEAPAPPPPPPRTGLGWNIALIAASAVLLVSAFLPWARVDLLIEVFGRTLTRDLGSAAGIEAYGLIVVVPVLAVAAIGLALGDLAGRDARISALAAVPGALCLLVCGLFALRLQDLAGDLAAEGFGVDHRVTIRYGWYLAVAASLLVIGFALIRPVAARRGE